MAEVWSHLKASLLTYLVPSLVSTSTLERSRCVVAWVPSQHGGLRLSGFFT